MATYGYIRVSTKTQSEDGLSIDNQQRQIEGYAMMKGLIIEEIFIERAVSGSKPIDTRAEGNRLIATLQPGDTLICAKLDRMFRNAKDALTVSEELRKMNVSLHLLDLGGDVTNNGISKMFFTIVAAFAEFERDRTAERITEIKAHESEKGRFLGGARPFGYRITENGSLDRDEHEQRIIDRIRHLRSQGMSLRKIAALVSTTQTTISHVMVSRVLSVP